MLSSHGFYDLPANRRGYGTVDNDIVHIEKGHGALRNLGQAVRGAIDPHRKRTAQFPPSRLATTRSGPGRQVSTNCPGFAVTLGPSGNNSIALPARDTDQEVANCTGEPVSPREEMVVQYESTTDVVANIDVEKVGPPQPRAEHQLCACRNRRIIEEVDRPLEMIVELGPDVDLSPCIEPTGRRTNLVLPIRLVEG